MTVFFFTWTSPKSLIFLYDYPIDFFLLYRTTTTTTNEETSSGETPLIINEGVPGKNGSSKSSTTSNVSRQHQVLWNLFAHNLDSVIMSLIESDHFKMW